MAEGQAAMGWEVVRLMADRRATMARRLLEAWRQATLSSALRAASSARAEKQRRAAMLSPARHARHVSVSRLKEVRAAVKEEKASCLRAAQDCRGLQRSKTRLLQNSEKQVLGFLSEAERVQEQGLLQQRTLREAIAKGSQELLSFSSLVASEKDKTFALEAELRSALAQEDERLEELRQRCRQQDAETDRELYQLQEQEVSRSAAFMSLASSVAAANAVGSELGQAEQLSDALAKQLGEAEELGSQANRLATELESGRARLAHWRQEASVAQAACQSAAELLPPARSVRRTALKRLSDTKAAWAAEKEACTRLEKDCEGLLRSGFRVHERLTEAEQTVALYAETDQEASRIEVKSLYEAIESLSEVHAKLQDSLAAQRAKYASMKEVLEGKLSEDEEHLNELKLRLVPLEQEEQLWRARVAEEEAAAHEALGLAAEAHAEAMRAGKRIAEERDKRSALAGNLHEARKNNQELRRKAEASKRRLAVVSETLAEAQRNWRLRHLEQVDARSLNRRAADKNIVISEPKSVACAFAGG